MKALLIVLLLTVLLGVEARIRKRKAVNVAMGKNNDGAIYGGKSCETPTKWYPSKSMTQWKFDAVKLNSSRGGIYSSVHAKYEFVLDRTLPYIYLPEAIESFPIINSSLILTNAKREGSVYTVECNKKISLSIKLGYEDKTELVLNEKTLILNEKIGERCVLAINHSNNMDSAFVMGIPFFRTYYFMYDWSKGVAFAKIKY